MVWWLVADLAVGMGNVCKDFGFCWGCVVGGLVVGYIEVVVVGVLVGRCVVVGLWLVACCGSLAGCGWWCSWCSWWWCGASSFLLGMSLSRSV